jgi:hypothetical protein
MEDTTGTSGSPEATFFLLSDEGDGRKLWIIGQRKPANTLGFCSAMLGVVAGEFVSLSLRTFVLHKLKRKVQLATTVHGRQDNIKNGKL